jgi:hypothetical protein
MNKKVVALFISFIITNYLPAQTANEKNHRSPSGKNNSLAAGPVMAAGNFSFTHSIGFSIDYIRTTKRMGTLTGKPSQTVGLLFNAGMNYFLGKKETVSSYPYSYPGYALFYGTAGLIVNPIKQGNFTASTGPGIRLYNGTSSFALYTKITASYFFHQRIAVTPSVSIINESGSKPLLAAGLSACFTF